VTLGYFLPMVGALQQITVELYAAHGFLISQFITPLFIMT
jgi:hypothetical protein